MMYHRGIWSKEEYLLRKKNALTVGQQNREDWATHKRDILPKCVVKLVRGWYPNPKGVAYMGYLWQ